MDTPIIEGLTLRDAVVKRAFDVSVSFLGLLATGPIIGLAWLVATLDTGRNGFFVQTRVGRLGKPFKMVKIRTMRPVTGLTTTVTAAGDPRITRIGRFFRKAKIDELPQLLNVFTGDMSFVGPRPDVPGFADRLAGENRIVLSVRPGITGPATLAYRNEEELLRHQEDPELYNKEVIFPDKVRINKDYIRNYSLLNDLKYIWRTLFC